MIIDSTSAHGESPKAASVILCSLFAVFKDSRPIALQRVSSRHSSDSYNNWIHPPAWPKTETPEFTGSVNGPCKRCVRNADARGIGIVRYPRIVPKDDYHAGKRKKRTLTNLYNEMPT